MEKSEGIIAFLALGTESCKCVNWWRMSDNVIQPTVASAEVERRHQREEEQRRKGEFT